MARTCRGRPVPSPLAASPDRKLTFSHIRGAQASEYWAVATACSKASTSYRTSCHMPCVHCADAAGLSLSMKQKVDSLFSLISCEGKRENRPDLLRVRLRDSLRNDQLRRPATAGLPEATNYPSFYIAALFTGYKFFQATDKLSE